MCKTTASSSAVYSPSYVLFLTHFFGQVQTIEDDLKTEFYKNLISFEKNKNEDSLSVDERTKFFPIPIFHFSEKNEHSHYSSAFNKVIKASHKKVRK